MIMLTTYYINNYWLDLRILRWIATTIRIIQPAMQLGLGEVTTGGKTIHMKCLQYS